MTELLFNKRLQVLTKNRDTDEKRSVIRVSIEVQATSSPVYGKVQLNPMSAKPSTEVESTFPSIHHPQLSKENGESVGLDSKYFERKNDIIALRGLLPSMDLNREVPKSSNTAGVKPTPPSVTSAYFPG